MAELGEIIEDLKTRKFARLTYMPHTLREGAIVQYVIQYTDDAVLEEFFKKHCLCSACTDDLNRYADPNDPYDYVPETVWGTGCACEWEIQQISVEEIM